MKAGEFTQELVTFQKFYLENCQHIMNYAQEQTVSVGKNLLDMAPWIPEQNRQIVSKWLTFTEQEQKRFSSFINEELAAYEKRVSPPSKAATPSPKKDRQTKPDTKK